MEAIDRLEADLRRQGAADYEIYLARTDSLSVDAKGGAVEGLSRASSRTVAVRVLDAGRLGFAYSTDLEPESLKGLATQVLAAAREASSDEANGFAPRAAALPETPGLFDPELAALPQEAKIERALILERAALAADPRLKKVRRATWKETAAEVYLRNSRGVDASHRSTLVSASVLVMAQQNGDSEIGWDFDFSHAFAGLDVETVGRRAAERALESLGGRAVTTCACAAVLDSHVASELIEVLASSLLAESVQKGKSLLAGRLGQEIASPALTLVDDGLLPGGIETSPFDDEGNPRQRTVLIEEGELAGFLYDQTSANREGCRSTGNASRPSLQAPPVPHVSNLYLEPGVSSFDELVSEMGRGLVIRELLGIHTANPVSGDFSVGASGHWVEGGRILHPVKGIAVSGNVLELLRRVAVVGSDLRFWGEIGAPSLLIERLDVGGTAA
jgi:PmbA protein